MDQCRRDIAARAVVADCIGGAKGYAWTNGGASILAAIGTDAPILSKYGANGCPDKGANGMFTYAKSKGCPWAVSYTHLSLSCWGLFSRPLYAPGDGHRLRRG